MSETKTPWTEGPWEIEHHGPTGAGIIKAAGVPLLRIYAERNGKANAHLIAAATEMAEALAAIAEQYDNQDLSHEDFRVRACQVALETLRKARGEEA